MKKVLFAIMCIFFVLPQFSKAEDVQVKQLKMASEEIKALAYQEIPANLSPRERELLSQQSEALLECSRKLSLLASRMEDPRLPIEKPMFAEVELTEIDKSLNLQYLQLQQKMQQENRQYTTISNIMKIKHDAANHAINNVR